VTGRIVVLKMKLAERIGPGRFRLLTRRTTLGLPTDDGKTIGDAALALWREHRPARPLRLIGVAVAGITVSPGGQIGLFGDGGRRAALNRALDRLLDRFGDGTVARGGRRIDKDLTSHVKRGVGDA
jgi:hypothetical protein